MVILMSEKKSVFEVLNSTDMQRHVKVLQKNKYVPWVDAWYEVKKKYPTANYTVKEDDIGNPFIVSPLGIFVKVTVTIEDIAHSINYPVMNGANKAMKVESYTYKVKEYVGGKPTGKFVDKRVDPATTFDVNTSIMRALTKCLALHGLAMYIYRDELSADIELVGSAELQAIMDKVKEKGIPLKTLCQTFNVTKPSEIWLQSFDAVINYLEQA